MSATSRTARRYRFGDASQPGVLLGLTLGQAVPVISGVLWLALCLQTPLALPGGVPGVVIGVVVAFGRWRGAPLTETLGPTILLALRRGTRRHRWLRAIEPAAPAGRLAPPLGWPEPLPSVLAGIRLVELPSPTDEPHRPAAVHDTRRRTVTGVLKVGGTGFPLASADDQSSMLDAWAAALSPFARQGCPVMRIAWHHWSWPAAAGRPLVPQAGEPGDSSVEDYVDLVVRQGAASVAQDVLVAVTVDLRKAPSHRRGSGLTFALETLAHELELFRTRLEGAGLAASTPLSAALLADAIRARSDPSCRTGIGAGGRSLAVASGRAPREWGPMVVEGAWGHLRVDGSWHRTFRVAGWPPLPVPADWLGALLTEPGVTRAVTVVMEPVPLVESARRADREAMAREADADAKSRRGFRVTARDQKRIAEVEARELELAQGHAEFRFLGLVDVVAGDEALLASSAATIEQAAARSLLDLRPLEARHDQGWAASLPLGSDIPARHRFSP